MKYMIYGKIIEKFNLEGKKVIFRYPKFEDLDDLLEVKNSLVKERATIVIQKKKSREEEMEWLISQLKKIEKREAVLLVVEVDGKVTGEADLRREKDAREHLGSLGILLRKEIRGRGIGERLLRRIIKEAEKALKIKMVKLTVMGPNKIAQNLYKKLGFRKVGRIKMGRQYYGEYVDEIIMVKYL